MLHQHIRLKAAAALGAAVTASVAFAPSAVAAPTNGHTIPVSVICSDGSSYALSTLDTNSPWAAFHDVAGTATLVPVYYSDVDVRVYTADGATLLFEEDSADYTPRGAVPAGLGQIKRCSFEIVSPAEDPDLGSVMIRVDIELGLWVAPGGSSR
jgi:hypothetical protein